MEKCLTCGLPMRIEVPIEGTSANFVEAMLDALAPARVCPISFRIVADRGDAYRFINFTTAERKFFYAEERVGSSGLVARTFLGFPLIFVDGSNIAGKLVLIHC